MPSPYATRTALSATSTASSSRCESPAGPSSWEPTSKTCCTARSSSARRVTGCPFPPTAKRTRSCSSSPMARSSPFACARSSSARAGRAMRPATATSSPSAALRSNTRTIARRSACSRAQAANKRLSGTLSVIMSTVGSSDMATLLDTVLNRMTETLDATGATMYFAEGGGFKLRGVSRALAGLYVPDFIPYGAGIPHARAARAARLPALARSRHGRRPHGPRVLLRLGCTRAAQLAPPGYAALQDHDRRARLLWHAGPGRGGARLGAPVQSARVRRARARGDLRLLVHRAGGRGEQPARGARLGAHAVAQPHSRAAVRPRQGAPRRVDRDDR